MYFITSLSNETCKTNAIKQNTSTTSKMTKIKHPKLKNPIEKQFNVVTRYHYFLFFIIFASKLPGLWHILNLIFLSPPMKYYCDSDDKSTNDSNTCPCDEPSWDRTVFSETVQTKFGIYCENSWLISFSESMSYVGLLVGSLSFGFLSDRYFDDCIYFLLEL